MITTRIKPIAVGALTALALLLAVSSQASAAVFSFTFTETNNTLDAAGTFTTGGTGADAGSYLLTNLEFTAVRDQFGTLDVGTLSAMEFAPGAEYNPSTGVFENHALGNTYNDSGSFGLSGTTAPNNFGISQLTSGFSQAGAVNDFYLFTQKPGVLLQAGFSDTLNVTPPPTVSGVPEPSTWAMMLLGFGGLGFMCHRKTRSAGAAVAA